ncbi:M1 family metallopeptidase [Polyangium aurulentum]|uniref:M1 family metallopeptidase n=1 Tax=Polyangium aurulentum TaxID=2567896 RepID=UPI00146D6F51|nr:M1 family metallopeptidase [Polyangium aurulentum]UQA59227.1 M1 family metallopeptidase [Polyangium aurulentum]
MKRAHERPLAWALPLVLAACGASPEPASPTNAKPDSPAVVDAPRSAKTPPPPALRLPAVAHPERYDLDLTLDPSKETFNGTISADLVIDSATDVLWLNATSLTVGSAKLTQGAETLTPRILPGGEDFVGFLFDKPLSPGKARLTVSYRGVLDGESSRGIYRQSEGSGPDDSYLYTRFEPIDARRAFPCFDEPAYKVPWKLTIRAKKGHTALANAPVASKTAGPDGLEVIAFEESKPMPSYLVAFVVGPFDLVNAKPAGHHDTPLRFIVPRGRGPETRYAAEVTPRIVGLLEDYFGMPYPFIKLDVAVVPRYNGTMEHPGIVAMGQPLTLIAPNEETPQRKMPYANIATHELAHYWFGDYVTMRWWDDTWLNEALAEWLDEKITDQLEPSWKLPVERLAFTSHAMEADSLPSAKKVRQPVESKHDIEGAFDGAITYAKGAAVIGMFERWMGPEKFQKAIRAYMKKHAWKNTVAEDFFAAVSAEAGRDLAPAFGSFFDQPGVPLISAEPVCSGGPPEIAVSQKRFVPVGAKAPEKESTWQLPVCVKYGMGKEVGNACTFLTAQKAKVRLGPQKGCPDWLMVNADAAGYYRSKYDKAALAVLLDKARLSPRERAGLVWDIDALVQSGELPLGEALALVPKMVEGGEPAMVFSSLGIVSAIRRDRLPADLRARYASFIRKTYGKKASALGLARKPGESEDEAKMRPALISVIAVNGEDKAVQKEAHKLALAWLADRGAVHASLAPTLLRVAARTNDRALYDRILAAAKTETDHRMRGILLDALGRFTDTGLAKASLDLLLGGTFDLRESGSILMGLIQSEETRDTAYAFFKDHFDELTRKNKGDIGANAFYILGAFCDEAHRAEAAAFFGKRAEAFDNGPRVLATQLERMDQCIAQQKVNAPSIEAFLKKQ